MDPVEAAQKTGPVIVALPAGFMLDGATYARGGELGFDGIDFYVAGRGGALGDVDGAVVAAAFVFFHPATIVERWDRGRAVMPPSEAARAFASCLDSWAAAHLADGIDYDRLAELEGKVIAAASPAGAPLFAAWSALPEPKDAKALALHRMNVLREWRGAVHGAAVRRLGVGAAGGGDGPDPGDGRSLRMARAASRPRAARWRLGRRRGGDRPDRRACLRRPRGGRARRAGGAGPGGAGGVRLSSGLLGEQVPDLGQARTGMGDHQA